MQENQAKKYYVLVCSSVCVVKYLYKGSWSFTIRLTYLCVQYWLLAFVILTVVKCEIVVRMSTISRT